MKTLFAVALFTVAVQAPQILPHGKTFEECGHEVDSFIVRTFDRISIAWGMCREEFKLASEEAVDESKESIVDKVKEGVSSAVQEKVNETLGIDEKQSMPPADCTAAKPPPPPSCRREKKKKMNTVLEKGLSGSDENALHGVAEHKDFE